LYRPDALREIIRVTLVNAGLWSQNAEDLLLETAAAESGLGSSLHQEGGPALGIYQKEPATLFDRWSNYITYRPHLVLAFRDINATGPDTVRLTFDPVYSTLMARVKYLSSPGKIPDTREARAAYWKQHYNTPKGKGTIEHYLANCEELL
jgi:hypothetical protein